MRTTLLTIRQVAAELNVSTRTVHRAVTSGALVAIRVGGRWRFHPADIDAYLAARRTSPPVVRE